MQINVKNYIYITSNLLLKTISLLLEDYTDSFLKITISIPSRESYL